VCVVTAEPAWNTPRMLLDCVAQALAITEKYSAQKVSRAIVDRLRFTGGLLIVDEANHLSSASIDQLRTFHDLAEIGIALVGNATVYSRLEGEGRKPQFAQLFSRIGMRLSHARPHDRDIDLLLDAWGIETAPERELLGIIARQPGALRIMNKTLRMALLTAGARAVTAGDIKLVWAQISQTELTRKAA
jgi:DNA transposition AAA+ family ATPase